MEIPTRRTLTNYNAAQNKNKQINHTISWKILSRCQSFNPATKKCNLCLREKFFIICKPEGVSLNNMNELFSTCRHRLKLLLDKT